MRHYKPFFVAFFAIVIIGTPWIVTSYPWATRFVDNIFGYIGNNFGAIFFVEGITIDELQDKYDSSERGRDKVRILIVPGHEPDYGGAEFGNLNERDMVVDVAQYMKEFFENNEHYEVVISRDRNMWNEDFEEYFAEHWDEIISFIQQNKAEMLRLVNNGAVTQVTDGVIHNTAPQNVAVRLYGINKWANENDIDIAIHIHFNDYPRRDNTIPGEYSGLSIYVPEGQYSNSTSTRAVAQAVFNRLTKYNAISDFPKENEGIVEEQELIAIGSFNTLDAPSMLIEYGYIYEPQFIDPDVRQSVFRDLAFQTYLGIEDFFGGETSLAYDTLMLPHKWQGDDTNNTNNTKNDTLSLQTALIIEDLYPPVGRTKNDCPRTGKFGPCTKKSLGLFQDKYGITGETDTVGVKTKNILNYRYSQVPLSPQ